MSRAGGRPEAEPLWATERNPQRETKGHRVANVSKMLTGAPFMPWQRLAADVAREIDPATGDPWYREVVMLVVRQAGKTTFVRADLTETCLYKPRAQVRYTAQTRSMALSRLERDIWEPINASPLRSFLNPRVGRRTGKPGLNGKGGQERISFTNDAQLGIDSVKTTSGHGPTLDKGAIDEAFAQTDFRVEQAMRPAMVTVPDAQLLVTSAAGDSSSVYLRDKVTLARTRLQLELAKPIHLRTSRTMFLEFAAGPDEDPFSPTTWWHRHPALGHTITEATLWAELEGFGPNLDEFARAYAGVWPSAKVPDPPIPRQAWKDQARTVDEIDWQGDPVWGVDVSWDREWTSIGMAAEHPGVRAYLEVIDHELGTSWAVRRLVQLRGQLGGNVVALDGSGPAMTLALDLEAEGFEVRKLNVQQKAQACSGLHDDIVNELAIHPDDAVLNTALVSAVKRYTGDVWTFWRGKSLADISPLYSVALARQVLAEVLAQRYDSTDSTYGGPED